MRGAGGVGEGLAHSLLTKGERPMISYPVLFGYRDVISGRHFMAFIKTDGRALLTKEEDGCWLYGVYPGGMAGGGKEIAEASRELKTSYLSVLFDIAEEASSFEAFKEEVERFFHQRNDATMQEWEAAHAQVKSGELSTDDLPRRDTATTPPCVEVLRVDESAEREPADFNQFDSSIEIAGQFADAA
jgi:hypothetical protein